MFQTGVLTEKGRIMALKIDYKLTKGQNLAETKIASPIFAHCVRDIGLNLEL